MAGCGWGTAGIEMVGGWLALTLERTASAGVGIEMLGDSWNGAGTTMVWL